MMKLFIVGSHQNGVNGHLTIHARIIEDCSDGSHHEGALETYGIDPLALQSRFRGDVEKWKTWVMDKMKYNHKCRTAANRDIHQWRGKTFDIKE